MRFFLILLVGLTLTVLLFPRAQHEPERQTNKTTLIVLIVIDQFGSFYIPSLRQSFSGGIRYLLDHGAYAPIAAHQHALPETCVGHASIATGTHPRRHGIIGNMFLHPDGKRIINCTDDDYYGTSPKWLEQSTLADWILERDKQSRIWSVSGKARSAVMLAGKQGGHALWYEKSKLEFISSAYYGDESKRFAARLASALPLARFDGWKWEPLEITKQLIANAKVEEVPGFLEHFDPALSFGESIDIKSDKIGRQIYKSPLVDIQTVEIAKQVLEQENLGKENRIDMLSISLSALDTIGHQFGPNSPHTIDTLMRADSLIGELINLINQRVGTEKTIYILTGDHGVAPLPEWRQAHGFFSRRRNQDDQKCIDDARARVDQEFNSSTQLLSQHLVLNRTEADRLALPHANVLQRSKELLLKCPDIIRVDTSDPLPSDDHPLSQRVRNAYFPGRGTDIFISYSPFIVVPDGSNTEHNSKNDYDTDVPLLIAAPGVNPKTLANSVETVDIAPTIAHLLNIDVSGKDGKILPLKVN